MTHPEYLLKFQLGKEEPETHHYSVNLKSAIMRLGWGSRSCENVLPKIQMSRTNMRTFKMSFNQN